MGHRAAGVPGAPARPGLRRPARLRSGHGAVHLRRRQLPAALSVRLTARQGCPGLGGRRDEGALSLFVAVCALTLLALTGLVLDGGGRLLAIERADAIAQEAARAGGQQLDRGQLLAGHGFVLDHAAAANAVRSYLDLVGDTQDVTTEVTDTTVTVHLTSTYHTLLLGLVGIGTLDVRGSGSAQVVHGVTAPEGN